VDSLFLLFGVLFFFGVYLKSWISSHSICNVVGGTQLWRNQHSFLRDLTDSFEGITSLGVTCLLTNDDGHGKSLFNNFVEAGGKLLEMCWLFIRISSLNFYIQQFLLKHVGSSITTTSRSKETADVKFRLSFVAYFFFAQVHDVLVQWIVWNIFRQARIFL
jgi:hypothetical protein